MSSVEPASSEAVEVARRFLSCLSIMDIAGALMCFADDGVQEMPYAPDGMADRLIGRAELERQYGGLPDAYRDMNFEVQSARSAADGWAVLEYRGLITLTNGNRYDNLYVGFFLVSNGMITLYREYFNPTVLTAAFGASTTSTFASGHN